MDWNKYLNAERLRESEREKVNDPRNEFESDFGRVIFSPAIRRMHDKTQVFPLTTDDNIHSRLTHSLEVMAIGYSLGLNLSENHEFLKKSGLDQNKVLREIPIILKSVCLVHDIGNPPFGHFGETVIQNYFQKLFKIDKDAIKDGRSAKFDLTDRQREDFEYFDGNAQGFRVLTKLQVLDEPYGLNLTFATLASYLKYPNPNTINKNYLSQKKRGVFQSEKEYLEKIAKGCGLISEGEQYIRHPLSFLMEAADSICYLVMDIEDGFNKDWYDYEKIKGILSPLNGVDHIFQKAEKKVYEVTKMVTLRIGLISYLVKLAVSNFVNNYEDICCGKYEHELINDDSNNVAKTLFEICASKIFPQKSIQTLELTGDSVITGLLDYYIKFIFHSEKDYRKRAIGLISRSLIKASLLENNFGKEVKFEDLNDYYKLRVIVDFITGMTDQYALNHFQKLSGQKIV
jgi:dGTPase